MELKVKDYQDYDNQIEIVIKTANPNATVNVTAIHDAIQTILVNAKAAYGEPEPVKEA